MKVEEYAKLPYSWIVKKVISDSEASSSYYFAECVEIKGCFTDAKTVKELENNQIEALESHIASILEDNEEVPLPVDYQNSSGKFVVRMPKSLHARLSREAKVEGVSLNQYAVYKLTN